MVVSTEKVEEDICFQVLLYTVSGVIVIVSSFICIVVLASSKDFIFRFSTCLALSFADLLNGLGYLSAAIGRYYFLLKGEYHKPILSSDCYTQTVWSILRLVSTQLPAYLYFLIALERTCSAFCFQIYHRYWDWRMDWIQILVAILLTLNDRLLENRLCNIMQAAGHVLGSINAVGTTFLYIISFIILVFIYRRINVKRIRGKIPSKEGRRKQNIIISITGISVLLVAVPSIFQILKEWGVIEMSDNVISTINTLFCIHSAFSFPVFMRFRPEFRKRFLQIFCCMTIKPTTFSTNNFRSISNSGTSSNRHNQSMFRIRE